VRTGESPKIRNPQSKIGGPQIHPREPNPKSKILNLKLDDGFSGVIDQRCYGCGRCLPICPSQLIYTRSYVSAPEAIAGLIVQAGVDALEIHTQVGHLEDFQRLWQAIAPWVDRLKLIAISCQDGDGLIDYLWALHKLITPLPCPLVWQTDGRPMSGDIGTGATRAAVKLSQKVLAAGVPGYVQLAGGTNNHTVAKLKAAGLLKDLGREIGEDSSKFPIPNSQWYVAGVAYGSYARILLSSILDELEEFNGEAVDTKLASLQSPLLGHLEEFPTLLWQAVAKAHSLVGQLKSAKKLPQQLPN
jgi:Fe-S-cluster-containing hydrogenase component 2